MGINLYVKGKDFALIFDAAQRVGWQERAVKVSRYGKEKPATEAWCVLYDRRVGGKEVARFKATEVRGYVYHAHAAPESQIRK